MPGETSNGNDTASRGLVWRQLVNVRNELSCNGALWGVEGSEAIKVWIDADIVVQKARLYDRVLWAIEYGSCAVTV